MAPRTRQLAFRLPADLVEQIDAYTERLQTEHPGLPVSRTDVVRTLLTQALAAAGQRAKRSK